MSYRNNGTNLAEKCQNHSTHDETYIANAKSQSWASFSAIAKRGSAYAMASRGSEEGPLEY